MINVNAKLQDIGVDLDTIGAGAADAFQKAIAGVASRAHEEWIRVAGHRLNSSRDSYVRGLQQPESFLTKIVGTRSTFEIALVGKMPNAFEFGMDSFDMKSVRPGWLGGSKAKTAKDGHKYIVIPFRHSITSAAHLAYSGKARRENVQKELVKTVKEYGLDRMVRAATGQAMAGSVSRVPNKAPVHSFLKGLTRVQHVSPTGHAQGQLMSWRIMSENSDAGSWVHPGISPHSILPEVEAFVDGELKHVIDIMFGSRRL